MEPPAVVVTNNPAAGQFEARVNGHVAVLAYGRSAERIVFNHTEVPPAARGHGVAEQLAHAGLEFARTEHLSVLPICPFVATYIRRHPEYETLVDEQWRKTHKP